MKRAHKWILSLTLVLALLAAVCVPCFAAPANKKNSAYGFFQNHGANDAIQVLETSKHRNLINYNDEEDAVSFKSMEAALQTLKRTNELRRQEGKPELYVTDKLMAMAMVDADYADKFAAKSNQYHLAAENFSWGTEAAEASNSWFGTKWARNPGQYQNMTGNYKVTGAATCCKGGNDYDRYGVTVVQVFERNADQGAKLYSVSQYEKMLRNYRAPLEKEAAKKTAPAPAQQPADSAPKTQIVLNFH
ncbi:MAG: hypothetical protein IJ133_01455 [Clostridia bacterium]|nr:hypothetical protein [Clostridia bacterium]